MGTVYYQENQECSLEMCFIPQKYNVIAPNNVYRPTLVDNM